METDNLHTQVTQHKYTRNTTHKQSKQTENNHNCKTLGLFPLLSDEIWITVMKSEKKVLARLERKRLLRKPLGFQFALVSFVFFLHVSLTIEKKYEKIKNCDESADVTTNIPSCHQIHGRNVRERDYFPRHTGVQRRKVKNETINILDIKTHYTHCTKLETY